ncbi:MAG: hypothetical protein ACRDL5_01755 [Solirubrobacteraceae bacterium]
MPTAPADRSHQAGPELAVAWDRRALTAGTRPFGVTAELVDQRAPVLAQVPLQAGALDDAGLTGVADRPTDPRPSLG